MVADGGEMFDALASDADRGGDRVHLVIPPSSEFLRTARLVAADAALRAGCDVDEVEDFRIAVDELCHLLMTSTDHFVHLSITSFDGHVAAHGSARSRGGTTQCALEEVSALIVAATADHHQVGSHGDSLTFDAVKRARHAGQAATGHPLASQQ